MEVEIRPEPDERKAVLAAVEALLSSDGPVAYRSHWRAAGICANVDDGADQDDAALSRRSAGATHDHAARFVARAGRSRERHLIHKGSSARK